MPVPQRMIDVTNIEYTGSSTNNWEVLVKSINGSINFGYLTNGSGFTDGSEPASQAIRLDFDDPDEALDIAAGETLTITYDSFSITVYLLAITSAETYYLDSNGVLFDDSALTTMSTPDGLITTETLTLSETYAGGNSDYLNEEITLTEDTMLPGKLVEGLNLSDDPNASSLVDESIGLSDKTLGYLNEVLYPLPNVPYLGADVYDSGNPIFDSRLSAETDPVISTEIKLYIKDNNDEWVDFTDKIGQVGRDYLKTYGTFKHSTEKRGGTPLVESSVGKVSMDNTDLFFEGRGTGLITEEGNAAVFHEDDGGIEANWREREVKFQTHITLMDDSVVVRDLGVYIIKNIESSFDKANTVSIDFESKMNLLKRTDASIVKDGSQWYRNRSIDFLVKELLKTQFADSNNELPNTFYINDKISLPVPAEVGGRAYSHFGRPPKDSAGRSLDVDYIRAMDIWVNSGTVTSTTDYDKVLNLSAGLLPSPAYISPKSGDYLVIKDSSNGNDGSYEIDYTISSLFADSWWSTPVSDIILKDPLNGTAEVGMSYTITRLFFIYKDSELWEFIPEGNTYNQLDTLEIISTDYSWNKAPYKIFINSNKLYILYSYLLKTEWEYKYPDDLPNFFHEYYDRLYVYNGTEIKLYDPPAPITYHNPIGGDMGSSEFLPLKIPTGMYNGGNNDSCENFLIPFTQIRRSTGGSLSWELEDATDTITDISEFTYGNRFLSKGFYTFGTGNYESNPLGWNAVFYDRGDFEIFIPSWSTSGILVTMFSVYKTGTTSYVPILSRFNMYNGNRNSNTFHYNNMWGMGMCIAYTDNYDGVYGNRVYISIYYVDYPYTYTGARGECRIYSIDAGGTSSFIEDTSGWSSDNLTVINMCQYGYDTDPVDPGFIVVSMNRDDLDNLYELGRWYYDSGWNYKKLLSSSSPFTKLKRGGVNEDYDVFIFHKYENRLLRYDRSANAVVSMANGAEVVADEGNISTPLVIDKYTRSDKDIIYGVSWTGEDPKALGGLKVPAKAVLWKLDEYLTPNIELADFEGLDVAEAIGKLAQACDHLAFFNISGNFFFVPREFSDFNDYVLEDLSEKSILYDGIKKDKGFAEIFNFFTIVPSITKIAEVEWEPTLVPRNNNPDDTSEVEPYFDFSEYVYINSLNNQRRKVRLVCTQSGLISKGTRFKWLLETDNIEARTGEEVSSSEIEFLLASTFGGDQVPEGVNTSDFIQFNHPTDETPIIKEILGGRGAGNIASVVGKIVTVYDVTYYNIGDKVVLRDVDTNGRERFTINKINVEESYVELSGTPIGTYIATDDLISPIRSSPSYIVINDATGVTIPSGSEVSIFKISASDSDNTRKGWSSDGITYIENSVSSSTTIIVNNIKLVAIGCYIAVGSSEWVEVTDINKSNNKVTLASAITATAGDVVAIQWVPTQSSFVEVPGTGFEIKISEDVYFKEGDVFTISTDGLILEDDSRSRKLAVSLASKDKHGKLDFPTIQNRFIYPSLSEILSRKLLNFYKDPHYHLQLKMYYFPYIDFVRAKRLSTFKIISSKLFPNSSGYSRGFYLRSMEINIKSHSITLNLVDRESY